MLIPVPAYSYNLFSPGAVSFGSTAVGSLGKALPIGRDLLLDTSTGDLAVPVDDLALVTDSNAVRQEVDITLNFLLGEWFLDVTVGVPYLQSVLVKSPNLAAVESTLRNAILGCVGISLINTLTLDFNRGTRVLTVKWSATTDLGQLVTGKVVRS